MQLKKFIGYVMFYITMAAMGYIMFQLNTKLKEQPTLEQCNQLKEQTK